jgi:hypothetical protein
MSRDYVNENVTYTKQASNEWQVFDLRLPTSLNSMQTAIQKAELESKNMSLYNTRILTKKQVVYVEI